MIKAGLILEQMLGHKTHAMNLKEFIETHGGIDPVYAFVPTPESVWKRMPVVRDDAILQIGLDGRTALAGMANDVDVAFMHTQNTATFCGQIMKRVPTIVSLDATPKQWGDLNRPFFSMPAQLSLMQRMKISVMERSRLKQRLMQRAISGAVHLVTWSEWAKNAVCEEYGIARENVTVIPPGVSTTRFSPGERSESAPGEPVRILFVGGDFARKGGDLLMRWVRETKIATPWELHIVTKETVENPPSNVFVHTNVQNNSDFIVDLYRKSDLFVLPTRADCLPVVTLEASASGLPIVASRVAAIPEVVVEGETGYLFDSGDYEGFRSALDRMIASRDDRLRMGRAARERALQKFSIEVTYGALVDVIKRFGEGKSKQP